MHGMANHLVTPTPVICPVCKTTFLTGGRGRPKTSTKYCSQRCNALARIRQPTIATLTQLETAYFAGVFDGEGSIVLWDRGHGGRQQLRCSVANTHYPLVEWLKATAGTGSIVVHKYPEETGYKVAYTWQCYGQNAVALLRQMLPFLIVKHDRALIAIASQEVPV